MTLDPGPIPEHDVDAPWLRALLAQQRPDLVDSHLSTIARGWDNSILAVGEDLLARLPRRRSAVALLAKERRWLPLLATGLPVPLPVSVFDGAPGAGYPWPWHLVPRLPGTTLLSDPGTPRSARLADELAAALAALHRPAPGDAPVNPVRAVALATRDGAVQARLDLLPDAA